MNIKEVKSLMHYNFLGLLTLVSYWKSMQLIFKLPMWQVKDPKELIIAIIVTHLIGVGLVYVSHRLFSVISKYLRIRYTYVLLAITLTISFNVVFKWFVQISLFIKDLFIY